MEKLEKRGEGRNVDRGWEDVCGVFHHMGGVFDHVVHLLLLCVCVVCVCAVVHVRVLHVVSENVGVLLQNTNLADCVFLLNCNPTTFVFIGQHTPPRGHTLFLSLLCPALPYSPLLPVTHCPCCNPSPCCSCELLQILHVPPQHDACWLHCQ